MINYAYFGAQINICTFDDILKIKFTRSELFFLSIFFFFWNRKPRYIGAWRYCARCFTPILLSQWSGSGLFCSTPTRPKPVCFTITCRACFKFSFCFWMEMRVKILMFPNQTLSLWSSPSDQGRSQDQYNILPLNSLCPSLLKNHQARFFMGGRGAMFLLCTQIHSKAWHYVPTLNVFFWHFITAPRYHFTRPYNLRSVWFFF